MENRSGIRPRNSPRNSYGSAPPASPDRADPPGGRGHRRNPGAPLEDARLLVRHQREDVHHGQPVAEGPRIGLLWLLCDDRLVPLMETAPAGPRAALGRDPPPALGGGDGLHDRAPLQAAA